MGKAHPDMVVYIGWRDTHISGIALCSRLRGPNRLGILMVRGIATSSIFRVLIGFNSPLGKGVLLG